MPEQPLCPAHPNIDNKMGAITAIVKRLEKGQAEMAVLQGKMYTSVAVMTKTLTDLEQNNTPDCNRRLIDLEAEVSDCKTLRAGPRIDDLEASQKTMVFGTVKLVIIAFFSAVLGASARVLWK